MIDARTSAHPRFRHDVLVHDDDVSLIGATRRFVARGLDAGADVLVHSSRRKVAMLEAALAPDPRLSFGYDEEMYTAPSQTLFEYQRRLAARGPGDRDLWVTGTVPLGATRTAQAAWARYESAVNEALSPFPFQALCTYDRRTTPPGVIAAARATHPTVSTGRDRAPSGDYLAPAVFLSDPMARVPQAPGTSPELVTLVERPGDLDYLCEAVRVTARSASAAPSEAIEDLLGAVRQVAANGVMHGAPPVRVTMWTDIAEVVVRLVDAGPGGLNPLAGYRLPEGREGRGLWSARHLVDDLVIDTPRGGGCRILLIIRAGGRRWPGCEPPALAGDDPGPGPGPEPPAPGPVESARCLCEAAGAAVDRAENVRVVALVTRARSANLRARARMLSLRAGSVRPAGDG